MSSQPGVNESTDSKPSSISITSPVTRSKRVTIAFSPTSDDPRGVRFQSSPTTIVGEGSPSSTAAIPEPSPDAVSPFPAASATLAEEDESERISQIRKRSRRRSGRAKRSPTPFVRRSDSSLNSEDENADSAVLSSTTPNVSDHEDPFAIASANANANATANASATGELDSENAQVSSISQKRAQAKERAKLRRSRGGGGVRFGGPEPAEDNPNQSNPDQDN